MRSATVVGYDLVARLRTWRYLAIAKSWIQGQEMKAYEIAKHGGDTLGIGKQAFGSSPARLATVVVALLICIMCSTSANAQDSGLTLTVNSTADTGDSKTGDDRCDVDLTTDGDQCTLRAAIINANVHTGPDMISFDIEGEGVQTITLSRVLPDVEDATGPATIDGYTQPGSSPNTDPLGSNAKIMVQIQGTGNDDFDGLRITSPNNVVRGLAFYKLKTSIWLSRSGARNNSIAGNFIGTDALGTYKAPLPIKWWANGVHISGGASNNIIGGSSPSSRNVISGNATDGVRLDGGLEGSTDSNVIAGNLIGLTPSGNARLVNWAHGIDMNYEVHGTLVGGSEPGSRNVISGITEGVEISHDIADPFRFPTANQVVGNFIGTDLTGNRAPEYARNKLNGVSLQDGAKDSVIAYNVIGNSGMNGIAIDGLHGSYTSGNEIYANRIGIAQNGTAIPNGKAGVSLFAGANESRIGPNNIIANNRVGILLGELHTDSNIITGNSIHSNKKLGIDIQPYWAANSNDVRDRDAGANQQQNRPILVSAITSAGTTTVRGKLNSRPKKTFNLELFSGPRSSKDEGRTLIASKDVNTDAQGNTTFTFKLAQSVQAGQYVTVTATNRSTGDTSEFSPGRIVTRSR